MNSSRVFGTAVITGMLLLTAGAGYLAISSRNSLHEVQAQNRVQMSTEADWEEAVWEEASLSAEASAEESSILVPAGILIEDVLVEKGDEVDAGQILAVVDRSSVAAALEEALAQEEPDEDLVAALRELAETQTIIAPEDGRIEQVLVAEGEITSAGKRNKERRSSEVRTTTASETAAVDEASMEETASAEETVSTEASDCTPITGLQIRELLAAALTAGDGSEESAVVTEQADPFQILLTDTDGNEILGLPADTESRVTEVLIGLVAEEGYYFTEDSVEDDGTADETLIPSGGLQWRVTAWEVTCDEDGSQLVVRLEMTAGEESTAETPTEATTCEASTEETTAAEASSTETTKKSSKSSKTGKKSGTGRSSGSSKKSGAGRSSRSGRTSDNADGTDNVDSTDTANSTGESSQETAGRGGSGQGLREEASSHVNFVEAFTYTTSL